LSLHRFIILSSHLLHLFFQSYKQHKNRARIPQLKSPFKKRMSFSHLPISHPLSQVSERIFKKCLLCCIVSVGPLFLGGGGGRTCVCVLPLSISRWVLKDCFLFSLSSVNDNQEANTKSFSLKMCLALVWSHQVAIESLSKIKSLCVMEGIFQKQNYQCRPPRRRTPFFNQLSLFKILFISMCQS